MAIRRRSEINRAPKGPRLPIGVFMTALCAMGWIGLYMLERSEFLNLEALAVIIASAVLVAIFLIAPKA